MSGSTSAPTPPPSSAFRRFKVFSTTKISVESAETDEQPKKFWLVESDTKSLLTIRPIDDQTWLPTGRAHPITLHELQKRYTPEADLYAQRVETNLEQQGGGKLLLHSSVEAKPVNESAVISDFQKGMDLLKNGKTEKADAIFKNLAHSEEAFEEKHKHLFNDFAIQLRKSNQPNHAIAFYTKALEIAWGDEDENLHINLARVLYGEKQYAGCVQHLFEALRISPGHRVAHNFLAWLDQQKAVPKQYVLRVKSILMHRPEHAEDPEHADWLDPAADEAAGPEHGIMGHGAPAPAPAFVPAPDPAPAPTSAPTPAKPRRGDAAPPAPNPAAGLELDDIMGGHGRAPGQPAAHGLELDDIMGHGGAGQPRKR